MKVIYEAEDGTRFTNAVDCEDYEWKLKHPVINKIKFYDSNDEELYDIFNDVTYENADKVVVPDEECVKELHFFTEYTGYHSYDTIDSPGTWVFDTTGYTKE